MRTALAVLLLASAFGFALFRLFPDAPPDASPNYVPAWTGARVQERPGFTVVRLAGTPRAKGRAHGEALRDRIRARFARLPASPLFVETLGPRAAEALPEPLRQEIEGIAEGCGLRFQEVWFLNLRFDIAGFEEGGFAGDAAVSDSGAAVQRFAPADLEGRPRELCVFVHLDRSPIAFVGLPGMAGGFLGCGPSGAAAMRPVQNAPDPVLTGLAWPLLFRLILDQRGSPRLPAPATLDASCALVRGTPGTFDLSPRGAIWHPVDAPYALARKEPLSETHDIEEASVRLGTGLARELFTAVPPSDAVTVVVEPADGGVGVTVHRDGVRFAEMIRFED